MARVLITGSSDGLGLMAAEQLTQAGHAVTLHARNDQRDQRQRHGKRIDPDLYHPGRACRCAVGRRLRRHQLGHQLDQLHRHFIGLRSQPDDRTGR